MSSDKFKVDFIGVGFPRCGTTWIGKCLEEHPDICFSNKKEVQFFNTDFDYEKGLEHYYSFWDYKGEKVVGEYTPEYFMYDKTLERIKKNAPDAKLIFCVRNPIDRAFSHYLYRKRKTGKVYPLEDIFNQKNIRPEEQVLYHGFYYRNIVKWVKDLSEDQYLILVHDDSKEDPKEFMARIYRFLNVDDSFEAPSLRVDINKSKGLRYKSRLIQNIYASRTQLKRNKIARSFIEILKKIGFSKIIGVIISWNFRKNFDKETEVMPESIRQRVRDVYDEDIRALEGLINRDLSNWK